MPIFDNYEELFRLKAPGADMGLKKVTIMEGASLLKFNARVNPNGETGTLIVGLGGSGFKLLNVLKKKYNNTLTDAENPEFSDRHVRFLAIDSDVGAGTGLNSGSDDLKDEERCGLWKTPAFRNYIKTLLSDKCTDPQKEWFDTRFADEPLDDGGCGGKRQKGRIMLSLSDNYNYIYNKVTQIFMDFAANAYQKVNVIIVAGISGGTGSGCIVDISYLLRRAARSSGCNANFEAFIFTPNFHRKEIDNGQIADPNLLYRNYIACLKEIDTLMTASETNFKYTFHSQMFPDGVVPDITNNPTNIFDGCTIVDAATDTGALLTADRVVNILSDYIIDMISDVSLKDPNTRMPIQLFSSILNNEATAASAVQTLVTAQHMPNNVDYKYRSIGYKTVEFPIDEITNYMSARILQNIRSTMFNQNIEQRCAVAARTFLVFERLFPQNEVDSTVVELYYEKSPDAYDQLSQFYNHIKLPANKQEANNPSSIEPFDQNFRVKQIHDQMENNPGTPNVLAFSTAWIQEVYNNIYKNMQSMMRYGSLDGKTIDGNEFNGTNGASITDAGPYAASIFGRKLIELLTVVQKNIKDGAAEYAKAYITDDLKSLHRQYDNGCNQMKNPPLINRTNVFNEGKNSVTNAVRRSAVDALKLVHIDYIIKAIDDIKKYITELCDNEWDIYCAVFSRITAVLVNDANKIVATAIDNPAAIVNIKLIGDPNATGKERKLNELISYYTDPQKIKAELLQNIYSSMLEDSNKRQWLNNLGHSFLVPENLRLTLSTYFRDLKADSDINSNDILERLLFILYSPESLTIDQCIELFKKHFDPNDTNPTNTKWNNLENNLVALYPNLPSAQLPLNAAATDIYGIITTLGFCSTLSSEMNAHGHAVTIDNFPKYDILILTERAKYLSGKIAAKFNLNDIVPANSPEVSGYSMVRVRYSMPLFCYNKMADWQKVYIDHVDNKSFIDAGVHQSKKGWRYFQPLVNLDAFRFMYDGDPDFINLYQSSSIYNEETTMMTSIKQKTDAGIETYKYITRKEDTTGPVPVLDCYILNTISDYNRANAAVETVLGALGDDVNTITEGLKSFNPCAPGAEMSDEELAAAYNKQFETEWNEKITKSVYDRLDEAQAPLKRSDLKYGTIFYTNDNTSTGSYDDSVNSGGVYKVIRFSPYLRSELDMMDKFCEDLTKKIGDKTIELCAAARTEWLEKIREEGKKGEKLRQLQMIERFAKCYATGHFNYKYDKNIGTLIASLTLEPKNPDSRVIVLLNTNLSTGRNYEKEFISFYLFLRFMVYLNDPANALIIKTFDNVNTGLNSEIITEITSAGSKAPVADKMRELIDVELPTGIFDLITSIEKYNSKFSTEPPAVFVNLPLGTTQLDASDFSENFSADNFNGDTEIGKSFYGQVYAYYSKLKSFIDDFAN